MAGLESTQHRLPRLPRRALVRTALLVVLLVAGGVVALLVDVPGVTTLRGWLDQLGTVGWVALVLGLALATLAPVPRTALSVLCGVLAGFWGGLALALVSGVLGALVGFALARSLGRETVTRLAGPRLARADGLLASRGAVAVLLGRLIPITPFTLVSYAGGLSGIPLRSYLLGSAVGLVPGTVLHVTIGATVGAAGDGPVLLLSLVPLALGLVALLLVHRWRARRRPAGPVVED
ncbi:TVP38/TMEM64 family protein [Modestobacter altitudinis]|uniref:TVP38/TMEM64 family protein n=1 Tax=Modestobacter altitudinis TaxID=2213158 RepID=UPI001FEBDFAD|nr:TVP38/TMEM64 family protein [Modestobacter altitudinis]